MITASPLQSIWQKLRTCVGLTMKIVDIKFWKGENNVIFLALNVKTIWVTMSYHCVQDYLWFMKFSYSRRIISNFLQVDGILSLWLKWGSRQLQCLYWLSAVVQPQQALWSAEHIIVNLLDVVQGKLLIKLRKTFFSFLLLSWIHKCFHDIERHKSLPATGYSM